MRQAIVTKYIGPTNRRGTRVKAISAASTLTVDWNYDWDGQQNHIHAARILAIELNWLEKNDIMGGSLPNSPGYCFVLIPKTGLLDACKRAAVCIAEWNQAERPECLTELLAAISQAEGNAS